MKNKKKLILIPIFIAIIIILITSIFILYLNSSPQQSNDKTTLLITKANSILNETKKESIPEPIKIKFDELMINNQDSKEKYEKLLEITAYFHFVYTDSNDPKVKKFIESELSNYAQKNFPKNFNPEDFIAGCSDPTCGEQVTPGLNKIIADIKKNSGLTEDEYDSILYNLRLAAYIPNEGNDQKDKTYGFSLAYWQLEQYGTLEASRSANLIKNYFENRYKIDLYILE